MSEKDYQERYFEEIKKTRKCALEVSVLNRCIDVVHVDEDDYIVTVEFKISNWRKAIQQARDHQLYSHKSYICMPKPKRGFNPEFLSLAKNYGIGIIIISTQQNKIGSEVSFKEELKAKKNKGIWDVAFRKIEYALNNYV